MKLSTRIAVAAGLCSSSALFAANIVPATPEHFFAATKRQKR